MHSQLDIEVDKLAGVPVDILCTTSVRHALFSVLKLPLANSRVTKNGKPKVDAEVRILTKFLSLSSKDLQNNIQPLLHLLHAQKALLVFLVAFILIYLFLPISWYHFALGG